MCQDLSELIKTIKDLALAIHKSNFLYEKDLEQAYGEEPTPLMQAAEVVYCQNCGRHKDFCVCLPSRPRRKTGKLTHEEYCLLELVQEAGES